MENKSLRGIKYTKHKLDLNSPNTREAFLRLGVTENEIAQLPREGFLKEEPNENIANMKFANHVNRVNETVRRIIHLRKEIIDKEMR